VIGYYVHHVGRGHATRATEIARRLRHPVTGLSTLPPPSGWPGDWVRLEDDLLPQGIPAQDATANDLLHWVPLCGGGLRSRMSTVSAWIAEATPSLVVTDVSVEIALLARLHGVPVVTVALPGDRGDHAHALGFGLSAAILAAWPAEADGMLRGLDQRTMDRVRPLGAIGRYGPDAREVKPRHALVMLGAGGSTITDADIAAMRDDAPDWTITVLGGEVGEWVDDPRALMLDAAVVVTHAGQNSIAEIAGCRRPAIVIPQDRPHDEQHTTARALDGGDWPVIVLDGMQQTGWRERLERAAALDAAAWARWNDGRGAARAAQELDRIADESGPV
jgi:hypothetical protein